MTAIYPARVIRRVSADIDIVYFSHSGLQGLLHGLMTNTTCLTLDLKVAAASCIWEQSVILVECIGKSYPWSWHRGRLASVTKESNVEKVSV